MIFSSILFIFLFLPITLILYYITPQKFKNLILFLISLVFYAWGEPIYIFLMFFTIVLNYYLSLVMSTSEGSKRKRILIETIVADLLILGFFKYYGFVIDNINFIFHLSIKHTTLPLPLGISFYTFQTLSYIIDVYRKRSKVQSNIINFCTYIAMFPQLISGPIVKYHDIVFQLQNRKISIRKIGQGSERFILGLGKKILLANSIGLLFTTIQSQNISDISVVTAWIGAIAYTLQIYFDFSGYSDMAIGIALMLGFELPENFNYPYIAKSITDFWRRWHISLSTWFRDYVYIPLGGNRVGILKQCRNLLIVWALTGFWHGASYNFIVWGLYYGLLLMFEKFVLNKVFDKIPSFIKWLYTIFFVVIGWVLFSSPNLSSAIEYIKVLFAAKGNPIIDNNAYYYLHSNLILFVILIITASPLLNKAFCYIKTKNSGIILAITIQIFIFVVSLAYMVNSSYTPFLYFKF